MSYGGRIAKHNAVRAAFCNAEFRRVLQHNVAEAEAKGLDH